MILKSESILMSEVQLESLLRCRDLSVSSEKWLATGRLQARRALPVLEEAGEQKWGKGGLRICYSFVLHFFPKASSMLGFSFRRLREERERMSGSGGRAVDGLWTGGSCRNSMGGG